MENKNVARFREYEEQRLREKTVPTYDYMIFRENHLSNISRFNSWGLDGKKKSEANPESKVILGVKNK